MAKPKNPKPAAKGRKSVPWENDPAILARLEKVENFRLQGKSNRKIAEALGITEATVRRDLDRIGVLMRAKATDDIILLRQWSLAQIRAVQAEAWETWDWMRTASMPQEGQPDEDAFRDRPKGRPLSIILEGERMVIDLEGTRTPVDQPVTLKDQRTPNEQLSTSELLKRADVLEGLANELLKKKEGDQAPGHQGAKDLGE